jgi:nucleotide-binding universal stress UspA family protein
MDSKIKKVLICVDTNAHSFKVADKGIVFARKLNAQISILHVISSRSLAGDPRERALAEKKKNKARKFIAKILYTFACAALIHIEEGEASDKILEKAASLEADIIILGNRTRKRASAKNIVNETIRRAECSVLTI